MKPKKPKPRRASGAVEPSPDGTYGVDFIARTVGLTGRRVQELAENGTIPRAGRGSYVLSATVQAYVKYAQERAKAARGEASGDTLDAARTQKTRAEAKLAEIHLADAEGRVIRIERHEARYGERCEALAACVRGLGRYAGEVQLVRTDTEAAALLERMSDALLAALLETSTEDLGGDDERETETDAA